MANLNKAQDDFVSAYIRQRLGNLPREEVSRQGAGRSLFSFKQQECIAAEECDPLARECSKQFIILSVDGAIIDQMVLAIKDVVSLQDALRLKVAQRGGGGYDSQRHEMKDFQVHVIYDPEADDQAVMDALTHFALADYSLLSGGWLCRAAIFSRGRGSFWICFAVHHIVFDYWSLGLVATGLKQAYADRLAGRAHGLRKLARSYGEFAEWQRSPEFSDRAAREIPVWQKLYDGYERPSRLSLRVNNPGAFRQGRLEVLLSRDKVTKIRQLARHCKTSFYAAAMSAFLLTLAKFEAEKVVLVGMPVVGRPDISFYKTIGLFANNLVVPFVIDKTAAAEEFVQDVSARIKLSMANQSIPGSKIQEAVGSSSSYQFMFLLQVADEVLPEFQDAEARLEALEVGHNTGANFGELCLSLVAPDGSMAVDRDVSGYIDFNGGLYRSQDVEEFWHAMGQIVDDLNARIVKPERSDA
ncbi:condensation domain-containing protein [Parerythrobacter aestuarii]|uniref:condensation domain-containing protein n=1 Tax=Parerythrobacter aestuarii TaxID=3020909 RepID=UPI0024DE3667|nr:condensation domain-containing protein [Parerythrobacter aestuarii]